MPATSQAQRRLFGWIEHTAGSKLPPRERQMKERMSHQQLHDFAATRDAGLPERVRKRRHVGLPRPAAGR